jgi:L(+)-tartrate dehydratase beta subunit
VFPTDINDAPISKSQECAAGANEIAMAHYDFDMPITEEQARCLRVNDSVTLNGTLFGIRDATQIHMFDRGRSTRFDMRGHAVVHTAPNVKWVGETQAAPTGYAPVCVGTTTSARMERFTRPLMQQYGVRIVIGKGGLLAASQKAFADLGGVYLAIIGGAAALETTWIESIDDVDLDDLNPESLWKFRVKGFGPLLVAMDSHGGNLYSKVSESAQSKRAAALATLGVGQNSACDVSKPTS